MKTIKELTVTIFADDRDKIISGLEFIISEIGGGDDSICALGEDFEIDATMEDLEVEED